MNTSWFTSRATALPCCEQKPQFLLPGIHKVRLIFGNPIAFWLSHRGWAVEWNSLCSQLQKCTEVLPCSALPVHRQRPSSTAIYFPPLLHQMDINWSLSTIFQCFLEIRTMRICVGFTCTLLRNRRNLLGLLLIAARLGILVLLYDCKAAPQGALSSFAGRPGKFVSANSYIVK